MNITFQFDCLDIAWDKAAAILAEGLGPRDPEELRTAFENSGAVCFAFDGDQLVGLGRALTDGVFQAAVYDLCLAPQYRKMGLGGMILDQIMRRTKARTTILYAVPGGESFYTRHGFRPMKTAMAHFGERTAEMAEKGYTE